MNASNQAALLAIGAIIVVVVLLIVGRALIMWWVGTAEIATNQQEIIRLLKVIANEKPSDATAPASKTPSHFR